MDDVIKPGIGKRLASSIVFLVIGGFLSAFEIWDLCTHGSLVCIPVLMVALAIFFVGISLLLGSTRLSAKFFLVFFASLGTVAILFFIATIVWVVVCGVE